MAKVASIQDFAGMIEGGSYYLEGFVPDKAGASSVLSPRYNMFQVADENDTGFSELAGNVIQGFASFIYDSNRNNLICIDNDGTIYDFNTAGLQNLNANGNIHTNTQTKSLNNDILPTKDDNILYTSADYLGIGYFGTATGSSSDTQIVDEEGRNFSDLDVGTSSHNNKVYNLTKGEEHSITSISTTSQTNDTLEFASGSTTNEEDDKFLVFVDKKFDFFSSVSHPQFKGQEDKDEFVRQIVQLGGTYYVGNGNWLGALDVDESTWDENGKQLPFKTQFTCMAENNDSVIVGGKIRGTGRLMLWDGSSDGWNNILDLPEVPQAIEPYRNGWLMVMGSSLYFTSGIDVQKQAEFPDLEGISETTGIKYNGMQVSKDRVFLQLQPSTGNLQRDKDCVAIFDFDSGWSTLPYEFDSNKGYSDVSAGAIKKVASLGGVDVFNSYDSDYGEASIGSFASGGPTRAVFGQIVKLDEPRDVNKISVSLSPRFNRVNEGQSNNVTIDVGVSDMRSYLWQFAQTEASTTDKVTVNTSGFSRYSGKKGQRLLFLDGPAAGDITWITNVDDSNPDEVWDVSPSLSSAPTDGNNFNIIRVKHAQPQQKTVDLTNLQDELEFSIKGVRSSRIYVEIVVESTGYMPDIHKIDMYG